jgi:hypothetical protein
VTNSGNHDVEDGRTIGVYYDFYVVVLSSESLVGSGVSVVLGLWLLWRIDGAAVMVDNGVMVHE